MQQGDGNDSAQMAKLGANLVALLQRCQVAEAEGLYVEVLQIETALADLRAQLAAVAERRRNSGGATAR